MLRKSFLLTHCFFSLFFLIILSFSFFSYSAEVHQVVGPLRSSGSTMSLGVIVRHEFAANDPRYYAAQVPVNKVNFATKIRSVGRVALRGTVPGLLAWAIIEGVGWAYNSDDELVNTSTSPGNGQFVPCSTRSLPRLGGTATTYNASGPIPCINGDRALVDDYSILESFLPVDWWSDLGQQWIYYSPADTHSVSVNVWTFEDSEISIFEEEAAVSDEQLLGAVQAHYANDVAVNTDLFRDPSTGSIEQHLFDIPEPSAFEESIAVSDASLVDTGDLGVTGPAPGDTPTGDITVDFELPDFCDWADWLCEPADLEEQPAIPTLDLQVQSYDSGLPSSASCPPPITISTGFGSWDVSYQFACDLAIAIKGPLIAIAYLVSAFIVVGVRR